MEKFCRSCGKTFNKEMSINIFSPVSQPFLHCLRTITTCWVENVTGFPIYMCEDCQDLLKKICLFRKRCMKVEALLNQRRNTLSPTTATECLITVLGNENEHNEEPYENASNEETYENENIDETYNTDLSEDEDTLSTSVQDKMVNVSEYSSSDNQVTEDLYQSSSDNELIIIPPTTKNLECKEKESTKKKKTYISLKNLTDDEIKERRRQQRRKDCMCDYCGKHFTNVANFTLHQLTHTGVKNFQCDKCNKRFYAAHLMRLHARIVHQKERPYACRFCDKSLASRSSRILHERNHTKIRPYSCPHCEKSFKSSTELKDHELIHSGIRSFLCTVCDKTFQRNTHLRAHLRSKLHISKATSLGISAETVE